MQLEGLGKLIKILYLIGSRARDLPACSIVVKALCYSMPPAYGNIHAGTELPIAEADHELPPTS
jgi:hypothetical protein